MSPILIYQSLDRKFGIFEVLDPTHHVMYIARHIAMPPRRGGSQWYGICFVDSIEEALLLPSGHWQTPDRNG